MGRLFASSGDAEQARGGVAEAPKLTVQFMLLANTSVAQIIANGLPEQSLLRRHEAPIERRLVSIPLHSLLISSTAIRHALYASCPVALREGWKLTC
jgi:hypothetical protein